jgi:hypothetical protein
MSVVIFFLLIFIRTTCIIKFLVSFIFFCLLEPFLPPLIRIIRLLPHCFSQLTRVRCICQFREIILRSEALACKTQLGAVGTDSCCVPLYPPTLHEVKSCAGSPMRDLLWRDVTPCTPICIYQCSSETSQKFHQTTRCPVPEECILHSHRCGNTAAYVNCLHSVLLIITLLGRTDWTASVA